MTNKEDNIPTTLDLGADFMNKIHHADSFEFMKLIPDNTFDVILTDPPYGMSFQSNHRKEKHMKIENDSNLDWLPELMYQLDRITKPDGHMYIFCSWHFIDKFKMSIEKYRRVKNTLVWEKNNTGMGDLYGDYAPKHELILYCSNGKRKLNGGRDSNIIKATRTQNDLHPTQKPVDLFEFLIGKSMVKGSKVFDPFGGSCTTAVASKALGVDWCVCELEEKYVKVGNDRLVKVQGSLF